MNLNLINKIMNVTNQSKILTLSILVLTLLMSFNVRRNNDDKVTDVNTISDKGFYGKYVGVEFDENGDVAHQFSNKVTRVVGKFLKESYSHGKYYKIDFTRTKITTKGLDLKGRVEFIIYMPFIKVEECESFTGLVHCGTWVNQKSSILTIRLEDQLKKLTKISVGLPNQGYFKTPEGYKEYWIQFKHKNYQTKCKKND